MWTEEVSDWGRRKQELGTALFSASLPHESDAGTYAALLEKIGVRTRQDLSITISIIQDAIMTARREERPTTPLENFLYWLEGKREGEYEG